MKEFIANKKTKKVKWFNGKIKGIDKANDEYYVEYEDGDLPQLT